MRVHILASRASENERAPLQELVNGLHQAGHEAHLGDVNEPGEEWRQAISRFDALLVILEDGWHTTPVRRRQIIEALETSTPTSLFPSQDDVDLAKMFGPQINILNFPWSRIPYRLALPELSNERRLELATTSLVGLSVGDAFGESFFGHTDEVRQRISERRLSEAPWRWTDDTAQGRCVLNCLRLHGEIRSATLAQLLLDEYSRDPDRGYGQGTQSWMQAFRYSTWEQASRSAFNGLGSYGNGAAMRAAPVGAYFSRRKGMATLQARRFAQVTHWHSEGEAGAEAVALAAAWAASGWGGGAEMLEWVRDMLPESRTRDGLAQALSITPGEGSEKAASLLGSGQEVAAWDTVPFALWCAAHYHHDFREAMWATVAGLGDRDTTCAIVGGIVALSAPDGVPEEWIQFREPI